jgi:hypothetical protein
MTKKQFQSGIERLLISAMGAFCMAEIAAVNSYPDHVQHWRDEVDRIVSIDLVFFVLSSETTRFNKRAVVTQIMTEYDSVEDFRRFLRGAKKLLTIRYLKNSNADLRLPDVKRSRKAFWQMVSEAVNLALQEA